MKKEIRKIIRKLIGFERLLLEVNNLKFENRKNQLLEHILHDQSSGVTSCKYGDSDIIVSLTTYNKRIYDVTFTIESIMQQSAKANRIVLWLDYSFEGKELPQSLKNQQNRGLEVMYCKDIRSYKKLIPSLQNFPDSAIITVDDDLLYEYDLIEHLINGYQTYPQYIQSCRGHEMIFDSCNHILPYMKWHQHVKKLGVNKNYFFTSGGGTLFPPHIFDEEIYNEEVFTEICKYADDVWFNAMAIKNMVKTNKVYTRDLGGDDFYVNEAMQDLSLKEINTKGEMLNDAQIKQVFAKYNIIDLLGKMYSIED